MPWTDRDDIRLYFDDLGSGHPVVLMHSFLCSREMWSYQAADLARSYRVINLDMRGHGESGPSEEPFTLDDLVDDVVVVLDHLGIERAVWGGLSIGGMIALQAALTVPDRVGALILADSAAERDPLFNRTKYRLLGTLTRLVGIRPVLGPVSRIMFGRTTRRDNRELVEEWRRRFLGVHLPSVLQGLDCLNCRPTVLDRLESIRVPTLVMVGEEDIGQPTRRSRAIAAAIPGAELITIPEAGHLSALEQPEIVSEAMRDFLYQAVPA